MSNQRNKRWASSISYTTLSTIVAAPVIAMLPINTLQANAGSNNHQESKVAICHRTNSVKNPYVEVHIDKHAYDGDRKSDHDGEHNGPAVNSEKEAKELKSKKIKWGDKYISEVSRGMKTQNKETKSENCEVEKAEQIKEPKVHPKNDEKPNKDDCKEDEPEVIEDDVITPTEAKEEITESKNEIEVAIPQVLAESTDSKPEKLADTGANSLMALLVGSSLISAALLLFGRKPAEEKSTN